MDRLEVKWGTSRGRETYGYTTCSLYVNGKRAASCNGGGYDMLGTVIGEWTSTRFQAELCSRIREEHYGLRFYPAKGPKSYIAATPTATPENTCPYIDGRCGYESVQRCLEAAGIQIRKIYNNSKLDVFEVESNPA